jgi:1-acyl-sn-glycerol-3-phosphate acyltransferase
MGERMSKQILGDNPFEDDEPNGEGDGERSGKDGEHEGGDAEERHGEADAEAARDESTADAEREGGRESQANGETQVPDAAIPDAVPAGARYDGEEIDDFMLGGEAAVPPGHYGPPIHSVLPDSRSITSEIRELERRVRERLTPAFPIEEPRRLPLEFVWKRYRRLAMRGRSDMVDDYGKDPTYTSRVEPVLELLTRRYFRVETHGLERVPETGRAILVANHAGPIPYDAAVLMHVLRREHPAHRDLRPLIEDSVYHAPYLGKLLSRIGAVRACQENAMRLLEDDELVAVFPEGSQGTGKGFKNRYRLQRFGRGGFIKLALRARAPVVPVAIVGSEETQPVLHRITWLSGALGFPNIPVTPTFPLLGPLGLLPLPAKWRIEFGEPLDLAGEHDPSAAGDRLLVNKLTEEVRSRIQTMVDEGLAARRAGT